MPQFLHDGMWSIREFEVIDDQSVLFEEKIGINFQRLLCLRDLFFLQSPQREKRGSGHVYGEENVGRHRRTPQKACGLRKRESHLKRVEARSEREKHSKSPHFPLGSSSPHNNNLTSATTSHERTTSTVSGNVLDILEESFSGYNSGDEHIGQRDAVLTPEEWAERDEKFVKAMSERGLIVKEIGEDGACLFRAISLQIYGDEDMHEVIRQQTMDYIYQNREYFAQFVTEDISSYVQRKRQNHVHGNHIEIQAMSEIYNRPVELYCYQTSELANFLLSLNINQEGFCECVVKAEVRIKNFGKFTLSRF